jgi:hypothetical protein
MRPTKTPRGLHRCTTDKAASATSLTGSGNSLGIVIYNMIFVMKRSLKMEVGAAVF